MGKKKEIAKIPANYIVAARKRKRMLEELYPEDMRMGDHEMLEVRETFIARDYDNHDPKLLVRHERFISDFCEGIMMGLNPAGVCELLEVPKTLYIDIMLAAAQGDPECAAFGRRVVSAQAFYEAKLVSELTNTPGQDWKKYAWLLERSRPERWSSHVGKHKADREYMRVKEESADAEGVKVTVFSVNLPDNQRDGYQPVEYIDVEVVEEEE